MKTNLQYRYFFYMLMLVMVLTSSIQINAQTNTECPGDFETRQVTPWRGYYGEIGTNGLPSIDDNNRYQNGILNDRQVVKISGSHDPVITNLEVVHSGGYSLKLGNENDGSETEKISKEIVLENQCLSFWYILVFEKPDNSHQAPNEMPFFLFRIKDENGNIIHTRLWTTTENTLQSTWVNGKEILFCNWLEYKYNFACDKIGKKVTLEFITSDCSKSDHFGYAYIDDICIKNCCPASTCEELFHPSYSNYSKEIIEYIGSTNSKCCYSIQGVILLRDYFQCFPYGIKVYEEGNPQKIYLDLKYDKQIFCSIDFNDLNFCINWADFTAPKTLHIAFYGKGGEIICDKMKQVINPCNSQSGCNCNNLFNSSHLSDVPIFSKNTSTSTDKLCCFDVTPLRNSSVVKCAYYGLRLYSENNFDGKQLPNPFYILNNDIPIGGPGANINNLEEIQYCVPIGVFDKGSLTMVIEYLDIEGKVICSRTEKIDCKSRCCENVTPSIAYLSPSENPGRCCFNITGHIPVCETTNVDNIEVIKYTATGGETIGTTPVLLDGSYTLGPVCTDRSIKTRYLILYRDAGGNILCHKETEAYCHDCCDDIQILTEYRGSNEHGMYINCCWDVIVTLPAFNGICPYAQWRLFDISGQPITPFVSTISPSWYLGQFCSEQYLSPYIYLAPGSSTTVTKSFSRVLALYDATGNFLCNHLITDACTRTYSVPVDQGPFQGGIITNPNPFDGSISVQTELGEAMTVNIKIINGTGNIVYKQDFGQQPAGTFSSNLTIPGILPGVYTLTINDGMASTRITKQ